MNVPTPLPRKLAPPPDFRYVGLEVGRSRGVGAWLGLVGAAAVTGTLLRGVAGAFVGVGLAAATGVVARLAGIEGLGGPSLAGSGMAIVPWGVVVELDEKSRILRWPGVSRVIVEAVHGRDGGTPHTRYSVVIVDTGRERFVGRAPGTVQLDRLSVHLEEYAREASHRIALDLDGTVSGEGPSEPDAELVLGAARAYLTTSEGAARLDLPSGYRRVAAEGAGRAGPRGVAELTRVLRDRTAREIDPRPFAAVLAAELGVREVADDLTDLVQSPLPLLAAMAKVAATKLGVAKATVGALDEVVPFLLGRDTEALAAWQGRAPSQSGSDNEKA